MLEEEMDRCGNAGGFTEFVSAGLPSGNEYCLCGRAGAFAGVNWGGGFLSGAGATGCGAIGVFTGVAWDGFLSETVVAGCGTAALTGVVSGGLMSGREARRCGAAGALRGSAVDERTGGGA